MPRKSQDNIRQDVTDEIIQAIGSGDLPPWRRCFTNDPNGPGLHTSMSTGNPYRGINQILGQCYSLRFGYKSKWWGTYNQIRHLDGQVRKGQKGHKVVLWKPIKRTRVDERGKEVDDSFLIMKEYSVFNAEQADGLDQFQVGFSKPLGSIIEHHAEADRVIAATGARIDYGGNQPCYRPHHDVIELPFPHQYESAEAFYETAFHELVHWAEKEGRVGRKEGHKYAFGELVAEIGACQLMASLNLPTTNFNNSAAYIKGWLKGLKNDPKFIFAASAQAGKAVDYILSFSRQPEEQPVAA